MSKFRKKPVVIEAMLYTGSFFEYFDLKEFVGKTLIPYMLDNEGTLGIDTLEGVMRISAGDWVIKGVQGEFYPCKPDIFEKTYEAVNE